MAQIFLTKTLPFTGAMLHTGPGKRGKEMRCRVPGYSVGEKAKFDWGQMCIRYLKTKNQKPKTTAYENSHTTSAIQWWLSLRYVVQRQCPKTKTWQGWRWGGMLCTSKDEQILLHLVNVWEPKKKLGEKTLTLKIGRTQGEIDIGGIRKNFGKIVEKLRKLRLGTGTFLLEGAEENSTNLVIFAT